MRRVHGDVDRGRQDGRRMGTHHWARLERTLISKGEGRGKAMNFPEMPGSRGTSYRVGIWGSGRGLFVRGTLVHWWQHPGRDMSNHRSLLCESCRRKCKHMGKCLRRDDKREKGYNTGHGVRSLFCNTGWKDTSRPLLSPPPPEGASHFSLESACMVQISCTELGI